MDERTTDAPSYHTFQHVKSIQARVSAYKGTTGSRSQSICELIVLCPGSDPTHDVNDVMSEG